jgi:membrane-associated phospholipid phosphatase
LDRVLLFTLTAFAVWLRLQLFDGGRIRAEARALTMEDLIGQDMAQNDVLTLVMKLASLLGGEHGLAALVFGATFVLKKEDAFNCATVLSFSILLTEFLKLIVNEPRPFFTNAGNSVTPCNDFELGNPSGHSTAFTSLALTWQSALLVMLKGHPVLKGLFRVCIAAVILLVITSRLYLGVHSVD